MPGDINEAKNMLTSFDDLTVYGALDLVSDTIHTALCVSEGPRKADQRLYLWDGMRYRESGASGLEPEIIRSVTLIKMRLSDDLAAITGSDKEAEKARHEIRDRIKSISSFLNTQKRRNLEATIRTLKMIDSKDAGLDADHTKVNLQNGVYDLVSHKLVEHDPNQRFTRVMPFALNSDAKAPMFTKHLEYVLPDPDTRKYLLEVFASSLLRSRREELIFFLWGRTAGNGKSELVRMLITAMGEYATWMDPHTFTSGRARNATQPEMLMAVGKALAGVDEPAKDDLDSSAMKNTANYADVILRGLYQASKTERWTATCVMLCNTLPPLDAKDAGAARRPVVIPFKNKITLEMKESDTRPAEYATMKYGEYVGTVEAAGIFNMLIEALKEHQARGCLLPPMSEEMREATAEYIYKNNTVARYVAERCVNESDASIKASLFHEDFKTYCVGVLGHDEKKLMLPANIREAMEALGYSYQIVKGKDRKSERCYTGLRLKTSSDAKVELYSSEDDQRTRHIRLNEIITSIRKEQGKNMPQFTGIMAAKTWYMDTVQSNYDQYVAPGTKVITLSEDMLQVLRDRLDAEV